MHSKSKLTYLQQVAGIAVADRRILNQVLNAINDDTALVGAVGIFKDLMNGLHLGHICGSTHKESGTDLKEEDITIMFHDIVL